MQLIASFGYDINNSQAPIVIPTFIAEIIQLGYYSRKDHLQEEIDN